MSKLSVIANLKPRAQFIQRFIFGSKLEPSLLIMEFAKMNILVPWFCALWNQFTQRVARLKIAPTFRDGARPCLQTPKMLSP